jgi:lipid-binding SYLF domain-containing protein
MKTRFHVVIFLASIVLLGAIRSAVGQTAIMTPSREDVVVDSATEVLSQIMVSPERNIPRSLLAKAEGIAIVPGMLKGGFIVGVRHGRGVIVVRDDAGRWKAPLFVQITGASLGWQAGVQGTDLVLVFRTKGSLQHLMRGNFTIGANVSAAAGPIGREAQAATDTTLQAEIFSYSRSRGLFAGVALDGAGMSVDHTATNFYYQSARSVTTQPGQPSPMPASASRLLEQIARYTTTTVPAPATVDSQALRRQLAASAQQLATITDAQWRTYLALPIEVYSGDNPPTAETLRVPLDRFATVAGDSRYQSLAQRPEFQNTWSLLRQYAATVPSGTTQPLTLPPPPK